MNQEQINRIAKQDPRYVLLDNICKKMYDEDEECIIVTLPINKDKQYVYRFYDSPTHPVSTIEVLVVTDYERWYINGGVHDMYSAFVKDEYIYTFGINRISKYDKRYDMLHSLF